MTVYSAYGFCISTSRLSIYTLCLCDDHTAGKKHSNCCEEGRAPGQGLLDLNEFNCTAYLLIA